MIPWRVRGPSLKKNLIGETCRNSPQAPANSIQVDHNLFPDSRKFTERPSSIFCKVHRPLSISSEQLPASRCLKPISAEYLGPAAISASWKTLIPISLDCFAYHDGQLMFERKSPL